MFVRLFLRRLAVLAVLVFAVGCSAPASDTSSDSNLTGSTAASKLGDLITALDGAETAMKDDSSRLGKEMSTFGAALTAEQQAAYAQAYHKLARVLENERKYVAAARDLAAFLDNGGAVELRGLAPESEASAKALHDAYKRLATTPYALSAGAFAAWAIDDRNQNDPVVRALASYDWVTDVLTPAITNGAGQALAEAHGDPAGAFAKLSESLAPLAYVTGRNEAVAVAWTALGGSIGGDMTAFDALQADIAKLPVVGALMGVGALYTAIRVGADVESGHVSQGTLASAGGAVSQLSGALTAAAQAGRLGEVGGELASSFASFVQRIAPGLGVLGTTAALRVHAAELNDAGALGAYIAALGDVLGLAGAVAGTVGVTLPLGSFISCLGATLSLLGDTIHDWLAADAIVAEERDLLQAASVDDRVASALVAANAKYMKAWIGDLGYDAPKLQWLASNAPEALTAGWFSGLSLDGFENLVTDMDYTGDGGFALLQSIPDATTESGGAHGAYVFVHDIGSWSFSSGDLRKAWIDAVQAQADTGAPDHAAVFTNAAAYMNAH